MKLISHLSDLHFGTEDPQLVEGLLQEIYQFKPSLVVVSGDLTQRATKDEFKKANEFFRKIPYPILSVPGNHDIPLYNVFKRFLTPLANYKKFIDSQLCPWFLDQEVAVLGLNTARSFTIKEGRISLDQMRLIREKFLSLPDHLLKVIVTHHPFLPSPFEQKEKEEVDLLGRAKRAMKIIEECRIDLLLCGHLHHGFSDDIRTQYPERHRSVIVAQAGTAISRRVRGTPNGHNLIYFDQKRIKIEIRQWNKKKFIAGSILNYLCAPDGWHFRPHLPN